MKVKKIPITICCVLFCGTSFAQRQNVYFFKESGKKLSTRDSADFVRMVSEPDSGTLLYNVKEYYKDGKLKLLGKTSKIDPILLEGDCVTYFPSGKKKMYAHYNKGNLEGAVYYYFPNGRLHTYKKYSLLNISPSPNNYTNVLIMSCADSTGRESVVDGNGHYKGYDNDFKTVNEEGDLQNGLKDGIWTENYTSSNDHVTITEIYNKGAFISGESKDENSNIVRKYTVKEREPQYPGGIQAFYVFLGHTIKYPPNARARKITGKVLVTFVVERDGSLTDVKVARTPDEDLGAEALRVVKISPKWEPGVQNGRPVRVQYTVPINFTLTPVN